MLFVDCLYGVIEVRINKDTLIAPELQRLRGIRLCNINSPYITGGDTLTRFEHAIGTGFLAQEVTEMHSIKEIDRQAFVVASLLHDSVTAPFGHSFEYLFEALKNKEYEHSNIFKMYLTGKTVPYSKPIYIGKKQSLSVNIGSKMLDSVIDILEQKHFLSKYLSNNIDIDNIDNVFRFAYHIGIHFSAMTPLKLAKSLKYNGNDLTLKKEALPLLNEWFCVREALYLHLLENEGDFVAKALLERCLIELVKYDRISENDWIITDAELLSLIFERGNEIARNCIQQLMVMDFPKYSRIMYTTEISAIDQILLENKIEIIDQAFQQNVFLHFIRDVNKTRRPLTGYVEDGNWKLPFHVGEKKDRFLIGFFANIQKNLENVIGQVEKRFDLRLFDVKKEKEDDQQISLF